MVRPGYKQTEVGEVPEDWDVKAIRDYNPFVTSGSRGWASYYSEYGSPFIRITNMSRNSIYLDMLDTKHVALPDSAKEGKRTILKNEDLQISITADVGISSYVDESVEKPAYINQHIALVRFDAETIIPKYVCYFLASGRVQKLFKSSADLGAKVGMNLDSVRSIIFSLPQLQEQKAIAKALSDVDELIVALEKLIAKKRDIKIATMQQLLTGKKRLPGFGGQWTMKQLGEISNIVSGGTPSTSKGKYWNGDILWCTPTDITKLRGFKYLSDTNRKITPQGLKLSSAELVPPNSIVMTSRATIGECAINILPVSTNQGFKNFIPNEGTDVEFLYYLLLTKKQALIGLCAGSTFLEIGKNQLSSVEVHLPTNKQKQVAISSILSDMDSEISSLEERHRKTKSIKQGMMQELLTGRTRLVDVGAHQVEEERFHGT